MDKILREQNKAVRILFLTNSFWPRIGGVQIAAAELLPALRERGHEVVVVTSQNSTDRPDEECYKGIPVYRFPFWKACNNIDELMKVRQRLAFLKRAFAPDLIH